jgi:hypothetical protein
MVSWWQYARRVVFRGGALGAIGVAFVACDRPTSPSCEPACEVRAPACDTCPTIAEALCVEGACVELGEKDASVIADVSIARDLDGVVAVVIAVVASDSCDGLASLRSADDVLAGTRVDVSGGPFHPDLDFGLVPAGTVVVAADGLVADDTVVGRGCTVVELAPGANDVGVVTVAPLSP